MAKRSKRSSGRHFDVAELVELVGAMSNIRNGNGGGHAVTLDPSVNVKENMELRAGYEKELRLTNEKWQERFDVERQATHAAERIAESGRLDSKIQDLVQNQTIATQELKNTATTLAKTVSDTADAARKTVDVAAQQQSELIGQVRDSVTEVRTLVTNFIAAGGATKEATTEQQSETRWSQRQRSQRSEWATGLVIGGGIALGGLALGVANFVSAHVK